MDRETASSGPSGLSWTTLTLLMISLCSPTINNRCRTRPQDHKPSLPCLPSRPPDPPQQDQDPENQCLQQRSGEVGRQQPGRGRDFHLPWECYQPAGRNRCRHQDPHREGKSSVHSPKEHLAIQPYNISHQNLPVQLQCQISPSVWSRDVENNKDHHQKSSDLHQLMPEKNSKDPLAKYHQ